MNVEFVLIRNRPKLIFWLLPAKNAQGPFEKFILNASKNKSEPEI